MLSHNATASSTTVTLTFGEPKTVTVGFAGPSSEMWHTGEAPWPLVISNPAEPVARWQRPIAKYVYGQDRDGNVGFGPGVGKHRTGENGSNGAEVNIAIGGIGATSIGGAMNSLVKSSCNIAIGDFALHEMTTPTYNTEGTESGNNIALGSGSLEMNNSSNNTVVGVEGMRNLISHDNSGLGYGVLKYNNSSVGENAGFGFMAARDGVFGQQNVIGGAYAGKNLEGEGNVALGYKALALPGEFGVAGCKLTAGSTTIELPTEGEPITKIRPGMFVFSATGDNLSADERTYPRGSGPFYVRGSTRGGTQDRYRADRQQLELQERKSPAIPPSSLIFVAKYTENLHHGGRSRSDGQSCVRRSWVLRGGRPSGGLRTHRQSERAARGLLAGYKAGSGNVMIGYAAGESETGSNRLYIANSNTATPLIFGEFAASPNAVLRFNADKISLRRAVAPVTAPTRPTNLQQVIELLVNVGLSL